MCWLETTEKQKLRVEDSGNIQMGMKCSFPVAGNLEVIGEIVMLNGTLQALQH